MRGERGKVNPQGLAILQTVETMWHPLSAVLLDDPRCFATPFLLRMTLSSGTTVLYAGDRVWPAANHGDRVEVVPIGADLSVGAAVLVDLEGAVDLLRVAALDEHSCRLIADADSDTDVSLPRTALLASCPDLAGELPDLSIRRRRRRRLDLMEAKIGRPDPTDDAADSVLEKYDFQAPQYAKVSGPAVPRTVWRRLDAVRRPPGRMLVIGAGVGRECFEFEQAGWSVTGLDFAPQMVEQARQLAEARRSQVEFVLGDIRDDLFAESRFAAAVTTFDVYSFLPERQGRIQALQNVRRWLDPDGVCLLSARLVATRYQRSLAGKFRDGRPWGASHTRWIDGSGALRRSFVQLFSESQVAQEVADAGFESDGWDSGYSLLK